METEITKKKRINGMAVITAITIVIIVGAVAAVIYAGVNNPERKLRNALSLGDRYLTELDYEQAIAAYQVAIGIDPKNGDAILGLSDAYLGQGKRDEALETLTEGYRETEDARIGERIAALYIEQAETLIQNEEYDAALDVLHAGYEQHPHERISAKIDEINDLLARLEEERIAAEQAAAEEAERLRQEEVRRNAEDMVKALVALLAETDTGDVDTVQPFLKDYKATISDLVELEDIVLYPEQNAGIYDLSDWHAGYVGIYVGGYEDGIRTGTATWLTFSARKLNGITWDEGTWSADVPNGSFTEWTNNTPHAPGVTYIDVFEVEDGLFHGKHTSDITEANRHEVFTRNYVHGKVVIITEQGGNATYPYGVERDSRGHIWYVDDSQINMTEGVPGWGDFIFGE